MNREEWIANGRHRNEHWRYVNNALKQWKLENNIAERCAVHHRDDTDETRKYNSEHYERWGFNDNGEFIEGQYVIFMTQSEHVHYHNIGKKRSEETRAKISAAQKGRESPMRGKHLSEETRTKISATKCGERHPMYGKKHSEETRTKISDALKGEENPMYGKHHSEEARTKMSTNHTHYWKGKTRSEETRSKMLAAHKGISILYVAYKNNGGILKWNDFRKALKNGEITFEMQPITVYTNNGE